MDLSALQSRVSSSSYIPPHRTQLHPRLIQYPNPNPKPSSNNNRDKWLIFASSLFVLPFLFYLFSTALAVHRSPKFSEPKPNLFGIVISAGSSSSRVHVYEFLGNQRLNWVDSSSLKVRPGFLRFSGDPEGAGRSILELIEFARERVPSSKWRATKVMLIGSEELEKVGWDAREAILGSCRRVLRSSGFLFKDEWAAIVKDQEEALYAWVAANYALGTLGVEPQETTGIVVLGGTSMQVVFSHRDPPPIQPQRVTKLAGITYKLYIETTSYPGQDAVWESLHELQKSKDLAFSNSKESIAFGPCIPRGYDLNSNESDAKLQSTNLVGNFSACKSQAMALLKRRGECVRQPCEMALASLVELPGKPVRLEKFFFISEIFGLVNKASLSDLERAGHHYCEEDWHTLKSQHGSIDDLDLVKYCFSSAYIAALLHDNLGIPMADNRTGSANQAGSTSIDWTLGAFIVRTMSEPLELETNNIDEMVGSNAVTYFSLFAGLLVAVLTALFLIKWQKPKLRTVYDLEKGHYIVTHVPR